MAQDKLARRLRVLRAERGLSLTEAAERIGVTRDTLSEIERGKRHPYVPTLTKIAAGYGVPVEGLLEEPALAGKAEASETGLPDKDEQIFDMVHDAFLQQSVEDVKTANRAFESDRMQVSHVRHENEALHRLLERPSGEVASAYVALMRKYRHLEQELARVSEDQHQLQEHERTHS